MIYIATVLILLLIFVIIALSNNYNKNKIAFESKINLLQKLIVELNENLESQNQKVRLSNDLKASLKESNLKLGVSILDLNYDMFDELYKRK
jgi:hypothetical protein